MAPLDGLTMAWVGAGGRRGGSAECLYREFGDLLSGATISHLVRQCAHELPNDQDTAWMK